jgi:hypothetical protein
MIAGPAGMVAMHRARTLADQSRLLGHGSIIRPALVAHTAAPRAPRTRWSLCWRCSTPRSAIVPTSKTCAPLSRR